MMKSALCHRASCIAPSRHSRRGLTLLEMILVLSVILAVAAVALPMLRGPMEDQRLKKTGDVLRAQWARARATAMQTGRMQLFQYQVGTDLYSVISWYDESDLLESTPNAIVPTGPVSPQLDARSALNPLGVRGAKLPEGITFYAGESRSDARAAEATSDLSGALATAGPPIVFFPDGSASDARVILTNQRFFLEVRLRGLTGIARVSDLLTAEELSR
jgi:prepilin-type N-terminal cleavage/methylation domain-containing protein